MEFNKRTKTRLLNLDDNKFEDVEDMNFYPSLLTPPSDSPERNRASSPTLSAGQNVYAPQQEYPMQYETGAVQQNYVSNTAYLKILEEPMEKFRFRYRSEMAGTHGTLTGRSSDRNKKQTYPTVQLCNYNQPAVIRCSVYQEESPLLEECQPHAHRLVKKNGSIESDDPHDVRLSGDEDFIVVFYGLGIMHTARRQIVEVLTTKKSFLKREEIARTEGKKRDITAEELLEMKNEAEGLIKNINLNIVRLRFDAFSVQDGIYYPICPPVYSKNINNLKSAQTCDLKIVRMDHCTSPCRGNREIFILVEKVSKKNIKIRFFELNDDETVWEDYGSFNDLDVHHQYAIVFKTPPYRDLNCDRHVKVYMELVRPSDGARSEPKDFTYTPCDPITGRKRPRTTYGSGSSYSSFDRDDEIPVTVKGISEENQVRSEELEEALKYGNISSSEVERIFNAFGPEYKMIEFPNLDDDLMNVAEKNYLTMDAGNGSKTELTDNFNLRALTESEKKIVMRVYGELNSFLKTKPDFLRKKDMADHIFKTFCSASGDTPFHLALYGQSKKLIILFMHFLAENPFPNIINATNNLRESVIHVAVAMGVVPVVDFLVSRNADLRLQNKDGNTALHIAVRKQQGQSPVKKQTSVQILNSLLRNEKNVKRFIDIENNAGDTALAIAIESRNLDAVRKLCLNGADVNQKHKKNGFTPLHMAVYEQSYEIVDYLLEHKDIELQVFDFKDCTPYKLAVSLRDASKVSQRICERIEDNMRLNGISEMVEVKEETSCDVSDDEEIKLEPMSPVCDNFEEDEYPSVSFSAESLNEVAKYLDESGNWKNLAELLDMEHFVRIEDISNYKSPSKSLLNMALANGESVARIRDFLENLDEREAAHVIDKMTKKNGQHSHM